jgi:hypothetical protein
MFTLFVLFGLFLIVWKPTHVAYPINGRCVSSNVLPMRSVPGSTYSFSGWFKSAGATAALFHYKTDDDATVLQELKLVLDSSNLEMTSVSGTDNLLNNVKISKLHILQLVNEIAYILYTNITDMRN